MIDTNENIYLSIKSLLAEMTDNFITPLPEMSLSADLQFDSIQALMFFSALEDCFNISFSEDELMQIETVQDVVSTISKKEK